MADFKISWSALERFLRCPYSFYLYYHTDYGQQIDRDQNRTGAIYGSVLQEVIARVINDNKPLTKDLIRIVWKRVEQSMTLKWEEDPERTPQDLMNQLFEYAPKVVSKIKELPVKKLQSEVALTSRWSSNYFITGRVDFKSKDGLIADGKATSVFNMDQIYYYAILYEQIYKKLPKRLCIFKYNNPDHLIEEIPINIPRILWLKNQIDIMVQTLEKNEFQPVISQNTCTNCIFLKHCKYGGKVFNAT